MELQGEAELLLSAGFDTTSAVIAAMFFYLTRNPSASAKLARKIQRGFANVDDIVTGFRLSSYTRSSKSKWSFPLFSIGSRACPGKRLADQEMVTTMARVMFRMEFYAVVDDMKGVGGPKLMWGRRNKTQWQVDDSPRASVNAAA